jgi:hypothetical protein
MGFYDDTGSTSVRVVVLQFPNQSRAEVVEQSAEKWLDAQNNLRRVAVRFLAAAEISAMLKVPLDINAPIFGEMRRAISEAR